MEQVCFLTKVAAKVLRSRADSAKVCRKPSYNLLSTSCSQYGFSDITSIECRSERTHNLELGELNLDWEQLLLFLHFRIRKCSVESDLVLRTCFASISEIGN